MGHGPAPRAHDRNRSDCAPEHEPEPMRSSMDRTEKPMKRFPNIATSLPLCLFAGMALAQDVVTLEELPSPAFAPTAGVSNIAADGTVVGTAWPNGTVVRWRPGQPPENLGGDTY